jgi:hypothetical protein
MIPLLDRFLPRSPARIAPPAGRLTPYTSAEELPENAGLVQHRRLPAYVAIERDRDTFAHQLGPAAQLVSKPATNRDPFPTLPRDSSNWCCIRKPSLLIRADARAARDPPCEGSFLPAEVMMREGIKFRRSATEDGNWLLRIVRPKLRTLNLQPHAGKQWTAEGGKDATAGRRRRATYTHTGGVRHLFACYGLSRDRLYGHIKCTRAGPSFLPSAATSAPHPLSEPYARRKARKRYLTRH